MLKKMILGLAIILPVNLGAVSLTIKPAKTVAINTVSVSTNTQTALRAGSDDLSGRTIIQIINTDSTYDVFIGTSSDVTTSNGFAITNSTDSATASISLPITSNYTLYGIGESNNTRGTIDVRIIEIKQ